MTNTMLQGRIGAMLDGMPDGEICAFSLRVEVMSGGHVHQASAQTGDIGRIIAGLMYQLRQIVIESGLTPAQGHVVLSRGLSDELFEETRKLMEKGKEVLL